MAVRPRSLVLLCSSVLILFGLFTFQSHFESIRSRYGHGSGAFGAYSRKSHPLDQLHLQATKRHESRLRKQSKTLDEAVAEYKRRHKVEPPKGFDLWYEFATSRSVSFIDEYDAVFEQTKPFQRFTESGCDAKEIDGQLLWDNKLTRLCIKDGRSELSGYAEEWYASALSSMIAVFEQKVPDVCVLINTFDEPRVVLPISRIESLKKPPSTAQSCKSPSFLDLSHQNVWPELVLSCPIDSPARGDSDLPPQKAIDIFGFVEDMAKEKDICLRDQIVHHGLVQSPSNLKVTHTALPILSPARLSTFQDILFPDVWRFSHMAQAVFRGEEYSEKDSKAWEEKEAKIYWRGSTTGGQASDQRWKHFQRQEFVSFVRSDTSVPILEATNGRWQVANTTMVRFAPSMDIGFTSTVQCEETMCEEQKEILHMVDRESLQMAWNNRYTLDLDGNGLSGRFYDLLKSNSAVMKRALFQEWHSGRLEPWLHYIPISNDMNDVGEIFNYFLSEEGQQLGAKIARQSKEWASQSLRMEDMQIYLYRVLLELSRRE